MLLSIILKQVTIYFECVIAVLIRENIVHTYISPSQQCIAVPRYKAKLSTSAEMQRTKDILPKHMIGLLRQVSDQGKVVLITLITSLFTIMPVGYHIVVLNVPEKIIQKSINDSLYNSFGIILTQNGMNLLWSITVACQSLGALLGCSLVIPISHRYGAKTGMMFFNNIILITGSLIMSGAYFLNFAPFLIIGRILTGVYTGIACALVPLFVQQIAPKDIKGSLSCFMHISVCFGAAMGAILSLDFMLGGVQTWGILLALPAVLGAIQIVISFVIPDTPNHLLQRGSYTKAIESILFYYDITYADEDEAIKAYWDMVPEVPQQMAFWCTIKDSKIRSGILLGMVVNATQIFSGSMVSISYSTNMFTAVSFISALIPFLPALGSIISIVMTIPALQMVESSGRRPLLLKTLTLCLIADCLLLIFSLLSSNQDEQWASWGFFLSFFLYGIGYNLGTGPIAYFIPAELVPTEAATASLGAAVATNWICTMITTFTYYPLSVAIGGWSYLLFIVPSTIFIIVLWYFLPETRFNYKEDPLEIRILHDLGPLTYGAIDLEDVNQF